MTSPLDAPEVTLTSERLIALRPVAMSARSAPPLAALPGGFATSRKGRGLEIAEVREYSPGDDLRHLDRGATARRGRLHVRQFQEERDRVTLLVADFRPSMFWGLKRVFRSVAAAEALALIGWASVETGGRTGLVAVTASDVVAIPPRGRIAGMLDVIGGLVLAHKQALQALMRGEASEDPPLDRGLSRLTRLTPRGADLVVASGFDRGGSELADRLDHLSRRANLRLLCMTDAEAGDLPPGRYPMRFRGERRVGFSTGPVARAEHRTISGHSALLIQSGDPVSRTARRLAGAA